MIKQESGKKSMKVGIVTLYRGYNYGTSLQAYALKNYITSLGYDAQIIWTDENTQAGRDIRIDKIFRIIRRSIFRPALLKRTFLGYKNSLTAEMPQGIKEKFLEFTKQELQVQGMQMKQLKQFAASEDTVAVICGSDQIWSAAGANVEPLYFLRFVPEKKRVSYAPSFGSSTVPSYNRKLIRKYLNGFAHISVREDQGAKIVKELTGRDVAVVLDPTLLQKWNEEERVIEEKNYIVAYFLNEPSKAAIESLKKESKRLACPIIAFPYKHNSYSEIPEIMYPDIGPKEFVSVIKNAKCVYTDSFHGTAFSINLQVPFWTFSRNYAGVVEQSSRITSLLKKMHLEDRYITNQNVYEAGLNLDFSLAQEELEKERRLSREYLVKALEAAKVEK